MLDTVHTVETPEGVRLVLRTAGPVPRALAYAIDATVRSFAYLAALIGLAFTIPDLIGVIFVLLFFVCRSPKCRPTHRTAETM